MVWLDRSETAQRLARDLVDQMSRHEARDELGLGPVRDVIADALAPGTSTIMTRARYFMLVPWLYRRVEQQGLRRPEQVVEAVRASERRILRTLDAREPRGEFSGVIGRLSLQQHGGLPQRLPSEIYWAGCGPWVSCA